MAKTKLHLPDFMFESSWEVCNKVGGIYTVLSTKAKTLGDIIGDNLVFIGPDLLSDKKNVDFTENGTVLSGWKETATKEGLTVKVGRWNVPGKPVAVLVDYKVLMPEKDKLYHRMWEKFGVDSLNANGDYDDCCIFSFAAAKVIKSIYRYLNLVNKNVLAQFHEWSLGMGVLSLKDSMPEIKTSFTTHATSIGRSICYNNKPLYSQFGNYDGDQMARELGMEAKHSLEKQAAHNTDIFTTVSLLTAKECKQFLNKEPDMITPNGFEADLVPNEKSFEAKRKKARKRLFDVAHCLIGEKILPDTFVVAISGRYEYKNKGIDLFIEALNRVRLSEPEREIIAFIFVPAGIDGEREDLKERLGNRKSKAMIPLQNPYYTHNLSNIESDPVCNYLRHLNFLNKDGKTKIIFVPSYLNGNDGIFNILYYDLLTGIDLTVFPSYYEPWGYTPLESIAFGIPTVTTNLTGFGLWAKSEGVSGDSAAEGVAVITRDEENYFKAAEKIKEYIIDASLWNEKQVLKVAVKTRKLAGKAEWKHFIRYYLNAYEK
ncbi:MAG: glycosyltransferase [Dysgonamonadaceae bacterium]|jgi:glycosyltransferase involved in cell wall biosynthesis|nr:glycosyltransferase [Dysgonamonadaceae bacterium]